MSLVLPHFTFQANALAHGEWPLWNPFVMTGLPELAGAEWGVAYPLQLALLPLLGAATYIKFSICLHFVLLALSARWLARTWLRLLQLPETPLALAFAAQCTALSGFWTGHLHAGHISFVQTLPWLVMSLAAGIETLAGRARGPVLLASCFALSILAGAPQLVPFGLVAGVPIWAWALWLHRRDAPPAVLWFGAALAIGACLAAVQVLPSAELTGESLRARIGVGVRAAAFGYQPSFLPSIAIPEWLADHGFANPREYDAGVGVPVLLLVAMGLTIRRLRSAALALLVGCVALLLLAGLGGLQFQAWLPGFSLLRVPSRMVFGLVILLPLVAATVLALLPSAPELRVRLRLATLVAALSLLALGLTLGFTLPVVLMLLWVMLLGLLGGGAPSAHRLLVAAGWFVLLTLALPHWETEPAPFDQTDVRLGQQVAARAPHQRNLWRTPKRWNTGMAVGQHQLAAYEAFAPWRTSLLMKAIATGSPDGPWPRMFAIAPEANALPSPLWGAFGVHSVVQSATAPPGKGWQPAAAPTSGLAGWYLPSAWPRAFWIACATPVANAQAALTHLTEPSPPRAWLEQALPVCTPGSAQQVTWQEDANQVLRLHVDAPSAGWLVVQDLAYPGWEATVNGRPAAIVAANGAGRAVPVPAGPVDVAMRYAPASVAHGLQASALGLFLLGVLAWLSRRRFLRQPPNDATLHGH